MVPQGPIVDPDSDHNRQSEAAKNRVATATSIFKALLLGSSEKPK